MICDYNFRLKKNGEPNYRCYCRHPELIENYDKAIADTTQTWEVHHRKEEFYSYKELKKRGEYYDVPPEELVFLTRAEHSKIDSACRRISEANTGKTQKRSKEILCVETGEIFTSTCDAERKTGISHSNISAVLGGRRNIAGGYHWTFI